MLRKSCATILMESARRDDVYPSGIITQLEEFTQLSRPFHTQGSTLDNPEALLEVELLFTGWGAPLLSAEFLASAPKLQAVFLAAGSVKSIVTDAFWASGIPIVSAASANAIPVAEYSTAQIMLGLKHVHRLGREIGRDRGFPPLPVMVPGAVSTTVGLVSLGEIGRAVAERLQRTGVKVIAYDPMARPETAARLGVELVGLAELFEKSQVVSIHAPLLPETTGMIRGHLVRSMPFGATLVNTSRGAVVNEPEMIAALRRRPDLTALLDVTWPEPPAYDSALFDMVNIILTPHVSGAMGAERSRMGQLVVDEAKRWLAGFPLQHEVTSSQAAIRA